MDTVTIIWFRHGDKAYANSKGPPGSFSHDPPLKSTCLSSVTDLGRTLLHKYGKPTFCMSSPYQRTRETMSHMLKMVEGGSTEYVDNNISEFLGNQKPYFKSGTFCITPDVNEATRRYDTPTTPIPQVGESLSSLAARSRKHLENFRLPLFKEAPSLPGYTVWVSTHGIVLRNILEQIKLVASKCNIVVSIPIEWYTREIPSLGGIILCGKYGKGATVTSFPDVATPKVLSELSKAYSMWLLSKGIVDISKLLISEMRITPRQRVTKTKDIQYILEKWFISKTTLEEGKESRDTSFAEMLRDIDERGVFTTTTSFSDRVLHLLSKHKEEEHKLHCKYTPVFISCGKFTTYTTSRMSRLLLLFPREEVITCALRYASTLHSSQYYGLTQDHVDILYTELGVRNEGFASPLDSRLAYKHGASFCSLFPSSDATLGSKGSFFNVNMASLVGHWYIFPPFIDTIIDRTIDKILSALREASEAKKTTTVYLVLPKLKDVVSASPFLRVVIPLPKRSFQLESPSSSRAPSHLDAIYCCLSSGTIDKVNVEKIMRTVLIVR